MVDLILLIILAEFFFLAARAPAAGRIARVADLFFALAPGACILLALRAAVSGAGWIGVALPLAVSFPIHIGDLARRRFW
jgi:hypothetical protein